MKSRIRMHAVCATMALGAIAGGAAGWNGPDDDSVALPGAHRLAFTGGGDFHATDNPVSERRLIVVPGSSTRVMLWSERLPDGRSQAYEAISLNGRDLLGMVRELDNTIKVRYQNFDPAVRVPAVEPGLAAGPGSTLHLVQFVCTPLDEFRATVEAMGGEIVRFMAENGYIIRMAPGVAARVAALPYVRWVGPFHTAYKFEPYVLESLRGGALDSGAADYSIEVFRLGLEEQNIVAARIRAIGGVVRYTQEDLYRMEATLSGPQLLEIARMNEVHFIGQPAGPAETDMDLVRSLGGANFIETTLGYTGQGVRAEVYDTELLVTHQEFSLITPNIHSPTAFMAGDELHGTGVFSISFARGATATARGLLPNSEEQNFFRHLNSRLFSNNPGDPTRLMIAADLANNASSFRSVYQTSSVGSPRNLVYNSLSQEMDQVLVTHNVLHCQSQSNAGGTANPQMSRPQAWAKNILSGGAVTHQNTASRADDTWLNGGAGGTSTGPAEDGRIKPDLCFFYDNTHAAFRPNNNSYTQFGGTSGATPSICGYSGLFHQMWHEGVWAGRGGGSTVFLSRPAHQLVKAALMSTAFRYNWTAGGPNASLDRFKQGFGMPDLQSLYNLRNKTVINNQEDALNQGQNKVYQISVAGGEPSLNVVMCYLDPPGTTSSSQHRINDLSLKVTAPNGTIRWGNNGLTAGNFNTTGGVANTKDTVECVFVQNPAAGIWTVEVVATQITQDAVPGLPGNNANFALWLTGGVDVTTPQVCLTTDAANNGRTEAGAGVFMNLTPTAHDVLVTKIVCETGTQTVGHMVAEIRTRPGTYVGFDGSAIGWTLIGSYPGTSDGVRFTIDTSANPIRLKAGQTTGVYLVNTTNGGVRYTGTGGAVTTSFADGNLTVFSDVARAGPIFTGDRFSPRVFAGSICYEVDYGGSKTRCTDLPLPAFSSTFTSPTLTRGYWFVAPTDFTICELQVPDESGHGRQNIEIVRLNANPPAFPAFTNAFTSLFRSIGTPSATPLSTQIRVRRGEVIGILGACGDATTMRNSYGAGGAFPSSILGMATTLTRMGMQFNLASTTARELWTEPGGSISRVHMAYRASPWASEEIPMPAFSSNFASNTLTRGFWFTAPEDMNICGLRNFFDVAGPQNVEVVRFDGPPPPAFPGTTNAFTSLFRAVGVNNRHVIQCNIDIAQGEVIGILGATGAATMNNSYGPPGAFNSTINGNPVVLTRMGMQFNLNSTLAQDLWTEPASQVSRVQVWYKTRDSGKVLCLDADTPATGSNLVGNPLNTPFGAVTFPTGELVNFTSDPEFNDAGAFGNKFDVVGNPPLAVLRWNFNVHTVTFAYGGNIGDIRVEAFDAGGATVDTFFQADTDAGQPAGPQILATNGNPIRGIRWTDTTNGLFAGLDNVCLLAQPPACPCACNFDVGTGNNVCDIFDFLAFQNQYSNGQPCACNIDVSTGNNVCDIFDFLAFQNAYSAGCP